MASRISDHSWTRKGFSLLWNREVLSELATPDQVISMRQLFRLKDNWCEDLPAASGNALIVAGFEGCLDALTPKDGQIWLERSLKSCILSFQDKYQGQAALILWLPSGKQRIQMNRATDSYLWCCGAEFSGQKLPLGQALWAGSEADARPITPCAKSDPPLDDSAWIGLYHPRIS
jgi:hypothetical protein